MALVLWGTLVGGFAGSFGCLGPKGPIRSHRVVVGGQEQNLTLACCELQELSLLSCFIPRGWKGGEGRELSSVPSEPPDTKDMGYVSGAAGNRGNF